MTRTLLLLRTLAIVVLSVIVAAYWVQQAYRNGISAAGGLVLSAILVVAAVALLWLRVKNKTTSLLVAALCLVGSPAEAATLLVEFGWEQPRPTQFPAVYPGPHLGPGAWSNWLIVDSAAQLPVTVEAHAAALANWNQRLLEGLGGPELGFFTGHLVDPVRQELADVQQPWYPTPPNHLRPTTASIDDLLGLTNRLVVDPPEDGSFFASIHVPKLGPGLTGYWLTRVEKVISADRQTTLLYGRAFPEPTTIVVIIPLAVCWLRWRCRSR